MGQSRVDGKGGAWMALACTEHFTWKCRVYSTDGVGGDVHRMRSQIMLFGEGNDVTGILSSDTMF